MSEPKQEILETPALPAIRGNTIFLDLVAFENGQRMATALSSSKLVPKDYQGNEGKANCLIAVEIAQRIGTSPLMVMQNLHIIEGRPSWSAPFIIGALNSSGRYAPLRFSLGAKQEPGDIAYTAYEWNGQRKAPVEKVAKDITDRTCVAWTVPYGAIIPNTVATLEQAKAAGLPVIEGPEVSIAMAVREGWYLRGGSKWQTMPELMLQYRAAAFFGRLYAPDILMGMSTIEEAQDMIDVTPQKLSPQITPENPAEKLSGLLNEDSINTAPTNNGTGMTQADEALTNGDDGLLQTGTAMLAALQSMRYLDERRLHFADNNGSQLCQLLRDNGYASVADQIKELTQDKK